MSEFEGRVSKKARLGDGDQASACRVVGARGFLVSQYELGDMNVVKIVARVRPRHPKPEVVVIAARRLQDHPVVGPVVPHPMHGTYRRPLVCIPYKRPAHEVRVVFRPRPPPPPWLVRMVVGGVLQ